MKNLRTRDVVHLIVDAGGRASPQLLYQWRKGYKRERGGRKEVYHAKLTEGEDFFMRRRMCYYTERGLKKIELIAEVRFNNELLNKIRNGENV